MKLGMNDREMILPCNGSQGAYINIEKSDAYGKNVCNAKFNVARLGIVKK